MIIKIISHTYLFAVRKNRGFKEKKVCKIIFIMIVLISDAINAFTFLRLLRCYCGCRASSGDGWIDEENIVHTYITCSWLFRSGLYGYATLAKIGGSEKTEGV